MTGWRVGYVHSDERNIAEILKVHDALVTCAPVVSQFAAMGALEMGQKEVDAFNREYKARRDLICARLDRLSGVFSYVRPQSSYYVFPRYSEKMDSRTYAFKLLDEAHVACVPGRAFGPCGEGHVRLSFGRSRADINEAFDRLERMYGKG
jgi:aminotransferase